MFSLEALVIVAAILPESLLPHTYISSKFGRLFPKSDGRLPERELLCKPKKFKGDILKIIDRIDSFKLRSTEKVASQM